MAALKIAKTIKDDATGMRVLALCDNNISTSEQGKGEIRNYYIFHNRSPTALLIFSRAD